MAPPVETFRYLAQLLATNAPSGAISSRPVAPSCWPWCSPWCWASPSASCSGLHRFSSEVAEPILVAIYSVPKITLYPIVLLAFGLGMPAKVAFGTIHGIVPVVIFTMSAVGNIRPVLLEDRARPQAHARGQVVTSVLFPAALPEIFTGLRVGFSLTLIGTLLGEMFGSQRGLGYLLMTAIGLQNIKVIMAVTLLVVLFAAAVSTILIYIDHRLHRRAS